VVLWSGSIDENHQQKIIAAKGVGCQKGRLVHNLFWLTTKRTKSEESIYKEIIPNKLWNP
jgi:hypothetical protein